MAQHLNFEQCCNYSYALYIYVLAAVLFLVMIFMIGFRDCSLSLFLNLVNSPSSILNELHTVSDSFGTLRICTVMCVIYKRLGSLTLIQTHQEKFCDILIGINIHYDLKV